MRCRSEHKYLIDCVFKHPEDALGFQPSFADLSLEGNWQAVSRENTCVLLCGRRAGLLMAIRIYCKFNPEN